MCKAKGVGYQPTVTEPVLQCRCRGCNNYCAMHEMRSTPLAYLGAFLILMHKMRGTPLAYLERHP